MIVKVKRDDKRVLVDVAEKDCPQYECFWITDRAGVHTRRPGSYQCGRREQQGCPLQKKRREDAK